MESLDKQPYAHWDLKGGKHANVPPETTLDFYQLEEDYQVAKKHGVDELGRFELLCKAQREKWEAHERELCDHDWNDIKQDVSAGKNLTGKLRAEMIHVNKDGEAIMKNERGWIHKQSDNATTAEKALDAVQKGKSDMTTKLEDWQSTARDQAHTAVELLKDYEHKADKDRRDYQKKYKY